MNRIKKILAVASAAVISLTAFTACSLSSNNANPQPIEQLDNSKIERLPGIAVWGSSMGYGFYGRGSTITSTIDNHMMTDECSIPIVNVSVPKETNYTVLARAGATKMITNEFTIPEGIEKVEIKLYSADNHPIKPLRYGTEWDGGMTNVTIAGIEGQLSSDESSVMFDEPIYYFTRSREGKKVEVKKGEQVISESMTLYKDYIPVICLGDDGGWDSFDELIKQQQAIIDTCKDKEKFIIVGMFTVPLSEEQLKALPADDKNAKDEFIRKNNEEYDKIMKEKWGEHYVCSREYLCSNVALSEMDKSGVEYKESDKVSMSQGVVPDILRYDPNILNGKGYELVGDAIYQKMVDLGYLYH